MPTAMITVSVRLSPELYAAAQARRTSLARGSAFVSLNAYIVGLIVADTQRLAQKEIAR